MQHGGSCGVILLATVIGGELFGLPGVVLAVPAMAMLRVLFDFFRVRVRVVEEGPTSDQQIGEPLADGRHVSVVTQGAGVTAILPTGRARRDA